MRTIFSKYDSFIKKTNMKYLLTLFALLIVISCANKKSIEDLSQIVLDIDNIATKEVFTEYFEIKSIVPIETKNDFLISNIKKVIYDQDNIIILTTNSCIFVVDSHTGNAKLAIDRKGNGPGESKLIRDITFDPVLHNIIVMNDYNKLLFFNLKGDFLYEELLKKDYENIVYDNGNVIMYNHGEGYSCYPYFIDIYNLQNKTMIHEGLDTKIDFSFRQYGRQIVRSKNIWFAPPLGFQIGKITKDNKLEFPYILETEKRITEDLIKLSISNPASFHATVRSDKIIYGVSSVRETNNFILFKTNILRFIVLNKNTLTMTTEMVYDKNLGMRLFNYYPHDGDDNSVMFIVQPNEWMEREKNEDVSPYLQTLIDSVKVVEDSNPILIFYKEKEEIL
jgi:hypothetical protein